MKLTQVIAGTALFTALMMGAAYAGDRGGNCATDKNHPTFDDIDADGNGEVSLEEFKAKGATHFAALDADGDGEISLEEFQAKAAERHGGSSRSNDRVAVMFKGLDADNSGSVSFDEAKVLMGDIDTRFADLDKDESGGLSEGEMGRRGMMRGHGDRRGHGDKECQGGQG